MIGMYVLTVVLIGGPVFLVVGIFWERIGRPLVGGWYRTGPMGSMYFLTRRAADRYGTGGLSAIDPYARFLTGPTVFVPGLLRRNSR